MKCNDCGQPFKRTDSSKSSRHDVCEPCWQTRGLIASGMIPMKQADFEEIQRLMAEGLGNAKAYIDLIRSGRRPPKDWPDLYAWMGEDELGSGKVGIKQALCAAGTVPIVSTERHKAERFAAPMKEQGQEYGKTIRLVRYVATEVILTVGPPS